MTDVMPPVPSDRALQILQDALPAISVLSDLLRAVTDPELHGRMVGQLREASANAKAEVAKMLEAQAALDVARKAHDEALSRELSEHRNKLAVERDDMKAALDRERHLFEGEKRQFDEAKRQFEADRSKLEADKAELARKQMTVRALAV